MKKIGIAAENLIQKKAIVKTTREGERA